MQYTVFDRNGKGTVVFVHEKDLVANYKRTSYIPFMGIAQAFLMVIGVVLVSR
jgi:hypothetical protein